MRISGSWRRCLAASAIVASGVAVGVPQPASAGQGEPYSQALRIPPVYTEPNIDVTMREACLQVLPGPCTKMWTYDGMFPGPTIRRPSGKPTRVTFTNGLPPAVGSTTVHHHGNHSESRFDGQPESHLIAPGAKFTYQYDFMERGEPERAAFQWYHDHRMDVTGRNVWMGLAGMFVLDDTFDDSLPLPRGKYDVPLMVVDRSFDEKNQLTYSFSSGGVLGDRILVNGVPSPYFEVADRKYRFRILNASNFREYRFELGNGQEMTQVASESGLLPRPVRRSNIVLGPAERAEVVVDFAGQLGQDIELKNTEPAALITPGRTGPEVVPSQVMQFRVRQHASDKSSVPDQLRSVPDFGSPATVKRVFTLGVVQGAGALHRMDDAAPQHFSWTINGRTYDPNRIDAQPALDSTERWIFVNSTVGQHRVHLHDIDWKVVSRRGGVQLLTPGDPDASLGETGLRDTFLVQSGETVEVEAKFSDHIGTYVFHCHILEHEDNGMMAQFQVVSSPSGSPVGGEGGAGSNPPAGDGGLRSSDVVGSTHGARGHVAVRSVHVPLPSDPTVAPALEAHTAVLRSGHGRGASDARQGASMAVGLMIVTLGFLAGVFALPSGRPVVTKLAAGALALQLVGLGWDMTLHAAEGEPLDAFENGGHLMAIAGIVLLGVVVALVSVQRRPTR